MRAAVGGRVVLLRKAGAFAGIGFINAAIDFAVFWTAVQAFDLAKIPANVLAWLVAVSFSYAMNSFTTFGPESGRILRWLAPRLDKPFSPDRRTPPNKVTGANRCPLARSSM